MIAGVHANAYAATPGVEVVGVADPVASQGRTARRAGAARGRRRTSTRCSSSASTSSACARRRPRMPTSPSRRWRRACTCSARSRSPATLEDARRIVAADDALRAADGRPRVAVRARPPAGQGAGRRRHGRPGADGQALDHDVAARAGARAAGWPTQGRPAGRSSTSRCTASTIARWVVGSPAVRVTAVGRRQRRRPGDVRPGDRPLRQRRDGAGRVQLGAPAGPRLQAGHRDRRHRRPAHLGLRPPDGRRHVPVRRRPDLVRPAGRARLRRRDAALRRCHPAPAVPRPSRPRGLRGAAHLAGRAGVDRAPARPST